VARIYRVGSLEVVVRETWHHRGLVIDRKGMIHESDPEVTAEAKIYPRKGAEVEKWARVIVYHKGKRVVKRVHRDNLANAVAQVKTLKAKGVKCHLVWRTPSSMFPPAKQVTHMRAEGYMWCPYCRTWRFFSVPRYRATTEIMDSNGYLTEALFLNAAANQDLRVCQWCHISENDWYVRRANGTFGETSSRRRARRRRRR